jgi:hypothetical protein
MKTTVSVPSAMILFGFEVSPFQSRGAAHRTGVAIRQAIAGLQDGRGLVFLGLKHGVPSPSLVLAPRFEGWIPQRSSRPEITYRHAAMRHLLSRSDTAFAHGPHGCYLAKRNVRVS